MSRDILLSEIDRDPEQPRQHFDAGALQELADSLAATGQAVAITVRPVGDRYVIVQGERRYRAAQLLGWPTIRAEVQAIDAGAAQWLTLVENLQRADLTPIEEANAYQKLIAAGATQTEIAKRIGKTQSYIAQKLRLLKMPAHLCVYVNGKLTEGHARQLLRLEGIYAGDVRRRFNPTERVCYCESTDDLKLFFMIIHPLEYPVCTMRYPQLHADAVEAFARVVAEYDYAPPAWQVCALWFAAAAADRGWSVSVLNQQINSFRDLLYAAIVSLHGHGLDHSDKRTALLYWSYAADLHHATQTPVDKLPESLLLEAYEWTLEQSTTICLPSIVQCGAAVPNERGGIEPVRGGKWGQRLNRLESNFNGATTLGELTAVVKEAQQLQNECAADKLEAERMVGKLRADGAA